ncbi:CPBP family intramembrane glutamic endopeptidase [Halorarius halobius]|uniref:CPBP family intramembrane glutamic endopeptidase n=1 Tax=Halorarius halobius TaxID=2962671 RepID=UPI0020CD5009|nr:CPBP family intramembrane glutamic endopeptidase [Halorarius halobius]
MATDTETMTTPESADGYPRRVGVAALLALPGLLALGAYTAADPPGGLSPLLAFTATVVNNGLLVLVAVLAGAFAAPRVGLRSHLLARTAGDPAPASSLRADLPLAAGVGLGAVAAVLALDAAFAPLLAADLARLPSESATVASVLAFAPVRFLYGGITEELLLRFGLMTGLAYLGGRALGREAPGAGVMWAAVLVSALLFGVGHLPAALAAFGELTPLLVVRTVLLNAVAGVAFGWLYWRRSLEAAMVAHGVFHVPLVVLSLAVVL